MVGKSSNPDPGQCSHHSCQLKKSTVPMALSRSVAGSGSGINAGIAGSPGPPAFCSPGKCNKRLRLAPVYQQRSPVRKKKTQ